MTDCGKFTGDPESYRELVYSRYASAFSGEASAIRGTSAANWSRAYDYYLRGWLPFDHAARIADLGCGSGRLLSFLSQRGYSNLVGVDRSPEQAAIARQSGAAVVEGGAYEFLVSSAGSIDVLLAIDLVEHFQKREVLPFLTACLGALSPGGRLIVQTPNGESPFCGTLLYGDFTHEWCYSASLLRNLLSFVGFEGGEAREVGPVPFGYGVKATMRSGGWAFLRLLCGVWSLLETGNMGSRVWTRAMLVSARKKGLP